MDHLPGVEKALSPPLVVPYLGRQGYDGQSFSNYSSRRGWDLAFLDRDDFTNDGTRTTVETAVMLQDWLYFGLIHEILGQTHLEYFAWDAKCGLIITTRSLPKHLEMWFSRVSLMTPEQGRLELEKSQACLLEVDTVVRKHLREDHVCDWPLSSEISVHSNPHGNFGRGQTIHP